MLHIHDSLELIDDLILITANLLVIAQNIFFIFIKDLRFLFELTLVISLWLTFLHRFILYLLLVLYGLLQLIFNLLNCLFLLFLTSLDDLSINLANESLDSFEIIRKLISEQLA